MLIREPQVVDEDMPLVQLVSFSEASCWGLSKVLKHADAKMCKFSDEFNAMSLRHTCPTIPLIKQFAPLFKQFAVAASDTSMQEIRS